MTTSDGTPVEAVEAYKSGKPKLRGFYRDGKMHGAWSWWRRDGSLMRTGTFDRGRQVGTWRTHDRQGRVVKETTFPS